MLTVDKKQIDLAVHTTHEEWLTGLQAQGFGNDWTNNEEKLTMPTVAYRVNRGRRKFVKSPKIKRELGKLLDKEVKPPLIKLFEMRVVNWTNKPQFKARKFIRVDSIRVDVFPAGENAKIWRFVSGGTRPHVIRARRARSLAFLWGGVGSYRPKTAPGGKFGGSGTVAGGSLTFPQQVQHPGSKPREFEKFIKQDFKREFSRIMENGFRRILRRL